MEGRFSDFIFLWMEVNTNFLPLPSDQLCCNSHSTLTVLNTHHADAEEFVRVYLLVDVPILQPQLMMDCGKRFVLGVRHI